MGCKLECMINEYVCWNLISMLSWDFFQYRMLRLYLELLWKFIENSRPSLGKHILLVKLPSGLHVAKSSKSEVRIVYIRIISWKFSWLRTGEKLYLIAQSTLNWFPRESSLKSTCVDHMLTKCWPNIDLLLVFHFSEYFVEYNV